MTSHPRTAIVGAGRMGSALAQALSARAYPLVGLVTRRPASARRAAKRAATTPLSLADAEGWLPGCDLVLVAVPDGALESVAMRLARHCAVRQVFLHHAGLLGPEALRPLSEAGAAVGVLHPLAVLGTGADAARGFAGARVRIEGSPRARSLARRLALELRMSPLRLPRRFGSKERAAYHAAASLVSNDVVALLGEGLRQLESAGFGRSAALEALLALARGTLDRVDSGGLGSAISGPAVRGDVETLRRQLERIGKASPDAAEAHGRLARVLIRLARREGVPASRRALSTGDSNDSRGS